MTTNRHSPSQRLHPLAWGGIYFCAYIAFVILYGVLPFQATFMLEAPLSDAGLILLALGFAFMLATLFFACGWLLSAMAPDKLVPQLLAASSVTIPGLALWLFSFASEAGHRSGIFDLSWFPIRGYSNWAYPVLEVLNSYVTGIRSMQMVLLAAQFVPLAAACAGMRFGRRTSSASRIKKLAAGMSILYGLVAAGLGLTWAETGAAPFTKAAFPQIDGATAAVPFAKIVFQRLTCLSRPQADRFVRFHTTHDAYMNLIEGKTDLIFAAGPSDEELREAETHQVKLKLNPIGKDAFVFLVHRDNPVQDLSVDQLRDIYTGRVTSWSALGGGDYPITAFQREANSGSQTFMTKQVMKGVPMTEPLMERKIGGMGELIHSVAEYRNSRETIGYSFLYYAKEMNRNEKVKLLKVNGVEPNHEHIRDGTYPFTATLYAVTRDGEPENGSADRLLNWLAGKEGRKAIEDGGYVPLEQEK